MTYAVPIALIALAALGMIALSRWLAYRRRSRLAQGNVLVGAAMQQLGIRVAETPAQVESQILDAANRCRECECMSECRVWLKSGSGEEPPAQCANRALLQGLCAESARANEWQQVVVTPLQP